jgi:hypothetical protein
VRSVAVGIASKRDTFEEQEDEEFKRKTSLVWKNPFSIPLNMTSPLYFWNPSQIVQPSLSHA